MEPFLVAGVLVVMTAWVVWVYPKIKKGGPVGEKAMLFTKGDACYGYVVSGGDQKQTEGTDTKS